MSSIPEIGNELRNAFSFLYLSDDIVYFCRRIGYNLDPVNDQLTNVDTAVSELITALDDINESTENLLNLTDPLGDDTSAAAIEFAKIAAGIYNAHDKIKEVGRSFAGGELAAYVSEIMGGVANASEQFAREVSARTLGLLVYEHFNYERPAAAEFFQIIGVLENNERPAEPERHRVAFLEHRINWSAISEFLSNPTNHLQQLYQWGADAVGLNRPLDRLQWFVISRIIPASVGYSTPQELVEYENIVAGNYLAEIGDARLLRILLWEDEASGFRLEIQVAVIPPTTSVPNPGIGFALMATISDSQEIYITENLLLSLSGGVDLQSGIYLALMPGRDPAFSFQIPEGDLSSTTITIAKRARTEASPHVLLGSMDGNRLEIGGVDGAVGIEITRDEPPNLFGEIQLNDGRIAIKTEDADGFIRRILPDLNVDASFDIIVGWSTEKAIYFRGSGGIDIAIPIHQSLGPVRIDTLYLSLGLTEQGNINSGIALSAGIKIGPIAATINRIGAEIRNSFPQDGGNKGPLQQDNLFAPPTTVGLAMTTEFLTGGGFLDIDRENQRYSGILQLQFEKIGLTAIGLIATRMPDGSSGFSMLFVFTASFDPPIQLPYNFNLSAVGGGFGANRTMKVEVIRERIKDRTIDSITFPEDPVGNASRIISDLRAVFPPREGRLTAST